MEKFVYTGKEELDAMESMVNYNRSVSKHIKNYLKGDENNILDFGAGIGTIANYFAKEKIICLEIDDQQREIISKRGFNTISSLDQIPDGSLDFVYSSNVLEHVFDDLQVVKDIYKKMRSGACIVLYLPAFQVLFSKMDERVGHFRRYNKKSVKMLFDHAGITVNDIFFSDSLGFFATILFKIIGDKKEGKTSMATLLFYDRFLYPISKLLDFIGFKFFLGKNILIAGRKI